MLKLNLMNKGNTPEEVFQMLKIANPEWFIYFNIQVYPPPQFHLPI